MKNLSIIIPIYNESKNLRKLSGLISKSIKLRNYEVIFVDDNSNDGSLEVLKLIKKKNRNFKYFIRKNKIRDLSQSCIIGFKKSIYKNILVMDGDLQHDPKDINKMIRAYIKKKADIVVGSRDLFVKKNKGLDFMRLTTSKILIILVSIILGKKTNDPMSGFFLFKKKIFTESFNRLNKIGYKILLDLIYSSTRDIKVVDVSINFKTRKLGTSKMSLKILIFLIYVIFVKFFYNFLNFNEKK